MVYFAVHFVWRNGPRYGSTLFDVQGLGKNKTDSIGDMKVWEKSYVVGPLGLATEYKYVCVSYKCPTEVINCEDSQLSCEQGDLHKNASQPFPPATLKLARGPMYRVAMIVGTEALQGLRYMDFPSPRLI